jgi:predicted DNA-binding protein
MEKKKCKNTSIRLGDELEDLIGQYAAFMGKNRSKVIREVLAEGLFQKTKGAQFQRLEEYLQDREAFTLFDKCEKCGSTGNLSMYHIDGDINNNASKNIVTLCIPCMALFEKFRLRQNIKEKFIEWFFS